MLVIRPTTSCDPNLFNIFEKDSRKRGDIHLLNYGSAHKDIIMDVTVGNPACATNIGTWHSDRTQFATIKNLAAKKVRKYGDLCQRINKTFIPLAFESYGAWSEKGVEVLQNLVSDASDTTQIPASVLSNYWAKRISCAMQRCNARCIINKVKSILAGSSNDECFDNDLVVLYGSVM